MPVTPLELGKDLLDRSEAMVHMSGSADHDVASVEADVLRAAWMFVGASVDTYFHERVRGALLTPPLSPSAKKFDLPLESVEELVEAFLQNRGRSRPRVRLKTVVHDMLLKETFQGSRNVERAFSLMGIKGYWAIIAGAMGDPPAEVKRRLNSQYNRRNRIAHQGDCSRQERRQHIWYDSLGHSEVETEITWTRRFLNAADLT